MLRVRTDRDRAAVPEGFRGILALLWTPLAETYGLGLGERAVRTSSRSSWRRTSTTAAFGSVRLGLT